MSLAKAGDGQLLRQHLEQRETPFDVLERGLGGVEAAERGAVTLWAVELLLPLQHRTAPVDPYWIASLTWALDFFARPDPALRARALALRREVLAPLRAAHPPPPPPAADDPAWAWIPAGTFRMGLDPGDDPERSSVPELPSHEVSLSAFRLGTHEVTFGEYRRLDPDLPQPEPDELPAGYLSWYEAYTYAAWLGGRLPTEAEWEYATRADCPHAFCKRDGSPAELGEVAWWVGNSVDPRTGEPGRKPVGLLEPNPWGLHDIYGNVHEWVADWVGPYAEHPATDPPGPTRSPARVRAFRGGCATYSPIPFGAARRGGHDPWIQVPQIGFRVALPLDPPFDGAADPTWPDPTRPDPTW
jgi:formylglycine-generating enzyme required for sulfatase activity